MPYSNLDTCVKTPISLLGNLTQLGSRGWGALLGPVVFAQADQYVRSAEVLVPGWVEDAVSRSEDPLITDQTCSAQQLLGAPLVQHHLPADGIISASSLYREGNVCLMWLPRQHVLFLPWC